MLPPGERHCLLTTLIVIVMSSKILLYKIQNIFPCSSSRLHFPMKLLNREVNI